MEKSKAKKILGYDWDILDGLSLDERFDKFRELYCPEYYELLKHPDHVEFLGRRDKDDIKEEMYKKIFTEKEAQDACCGRRVETEAFLRFADVHDAYNTLSKNEEYKEYSLEYDDINEYEKKRYGEKVAKCKKIASEISSIGIVSTIIWVAAFVLGVILNGNILGDIVQTLFYLVGPCVLLIRIADVISAPIEHLLFIPLKVWDCVSDVWDSRSSIIANIFGVIFNFAYSLVISTFIFLINPNVGTRLKLERYKKREDYKVFCIQLVNARYNRTLIDIKNYINHIGIEKYNSTDEAVTYYLKTHGKIPADVTKRGCKVLPRKDSFCIIAYKEILKEMRKSEENLEKAKGSALDDAFKSEQKSQRRLSKEESKEWYEVINYHEWDRDEDIEEAYKTAEQSIKIYENIAKEKKKIYKYELELVKKRITVAAATADYLANVKNN